MIKKLREKNRSSSTALLEEMTLLVFAVLASGFHGTLKESSGNKNTDTIDLHGLQRELH